MIRDPLAFIVAVRMRLTRREMIISENNRHNSIPDLEVLSLDERGYPTGADSIAWATYDYRQAETIRNALLTQHISCELKPETVRGITLYLLHIDDARELGEAIDFVWRDNSGLRLEPDWNYPGGAVNRSFEKWVGGV